PDRAPPRQAAVVRSDRTPTAHRRLRRRSSTADQTRSLVAVLSGLSDDRRLSGLLSHPPSFVSCTVSLIVILVPLPGAGSIACLAPISGARSQSPTSPGPRFGDSPSVGRALPFPLSSIAIVIVC